MGGELKVIALKFQVFHLPIAELHNYPGSVYPVMYTKASPHKVKTSEIETKS